VRRSGSALRRLQLLALLPLVGGIGGLLLTSGASAQTSNPNTYTLSAQANALDALLTDSSLPLSGDLAYEAGPWGASATIDSLGESMADAGAPYSPSFASLPGTVNGLGSGNLPPLPPLPGYVTAQYPSTPTDSETQGGYQIASSASPNDAKGTVSLGAQPSGASHSTFFASAETTANSDGSVTVSASAGIDAVDLGQLLDLGDVGSSISMTQQASQQPKVTSETSLGTVTLLGEASGLVPSGLNVLGVNAPIDLNSEVIGALDTALAGAGVKLTYLPETFTYTDGTSSTGTTPLDSKTLEGVDSGALQVSVTQNLPSQGPTSVILTLGRVYVSTTDSPGLAAGTGNTGAVGNTGSAPASVATAPAVPTGNTGTVTAPASAAPVIPAPSTPAATSTPTTQAPASSPAFALDRGPPVQSVYLVLVLGALIVLLGAQAVRYLAVRLALSGQPA
jgi:hypothetical protein